MDRATEDRWREALAKQGEDVVRQKLDLRPGPPSELRYDIVDEPPFPNRAFCEAWCRGVPARTFGMSRAGAMVVIMSVLVVVCGLQAFSGWSKNGSNWLSAKTGQFHPMPRPAPLPRGGWAASDDTIRNGALQNQAAANGSNISTQQRASMLPDCSSVSSAGDVATVRSQKPCSSLGQPFVKHGTGPGG